MKSKSVLLLAAAILGITTACAPVENSSLPGTDTSHPTSTSEIKVVGIEIVSEGNKQSIKEGETLQLTANVYPENASQEVLWSSSDETLATVNANGLVTAVKKGTVEIVATSKVDGNVKKSFSLIIEEKEPEVITPTEIQLTTEGNVTTLKAGETLTVNAKVLPEGASQRVIWSTSDDTVASVSSGVVTGLKEGSVTISATSSEVATVKAAIKLTVTKGDGPITTIEWDKINYATHDEYMNADKNTPLKIKGVVTFVSPRNAENKVNFYIQNGTDGYYVYEHDAIVLPVEEGKVYEVGGFKSSNAGSLRISDTEICNELTETITYQTRSLEGQDVSNFDAMKEYYGSIVEADATIVTLPSDTTEAYNLGVSISGKDIDIRIDPDFLGQAGFENITSKINASYVNVPLHFKGAMSAYGWGKTPDPQIQLLRENELTIQEATDEQKVAAAKENLSLVTVIEKETTNIELATTSIVDGVSIVWSSSNESVISNTGVVTHQERDVEVTLTATLSSGAIKDSKQFKIIVIGTSDYLVEVARLDLEDAKPANKYGCSETKSSYSDGTVELGTPTYTWLLQNALIGGDGRDKCEGTFAVRAKPKDTFDTTGKIELQEDVEINVVDFLAASYGEHAVGSDIDIAYSVDGTTWVRMNTGLKITSSSLTHYRVNLPETAKRAAIYIVENTIKSTVNFDNISFLK